MFDYIAAFGIGLVGSLHCLGMCGPLVLAYSLNMQAGGGLQVAQNSFHHGLFHLGRLITYGFLGALAALLFYLTDLGRVFTQIRGSVSLAGGALMVGLGLVLLRILPLPQCLSRLLADSGARWSGLTSPLLRSRDLKSKVALGLAMGFLPCGLSWAMIVKAATTQHVGRGFLTMAAFGLGTIPALFLTGFAASFVTDGFRTLGDKVAACSVIAMGAILVFRGARIFV